MNMNRSFNSVKMRNLGNICGCFFVMSRTDAQNDLHVSLKYLLHILWEVFWKDLIANKMIFNEGATFNYQLTKTHPPIEYR